MKETIKEDNEDFIRIALQSRQCGKAPPLVIHLDDYFGLSPFWSHKVTTSMQWKETILKLAKWYDTGLISYADVVRDLVYQKTSDERFHNDQNLHYGHWPHQIIAWTLGFASIELITNYCSDEEERRASLRSFERKSYVSKERQFYLMPRLTDSLSMDNITLTMKDAKTASYMENCESNTTRSKSCALSLTQFRLNDGTRDYKQEMQNFMTKYGGAGGQWKVMQDGGKIGWSASTPKSYFTLSFDAFKQDVNTVTILYIQSYGAKWANSKAKFTLSADIEMSKGKAYKKDEFGLRILWQGSLFGDHVETFTDIKSFEVHLTTPIPKGTKAKFNVDLVSGSSFKITGLIFCKKSPSEWQTNVKDSRIDCSKNTWGRLKQGC